jgi:hypothetical protein
LSLAAHHPAAPSRPLRLPRLWAGFHRDAAQDLRGEGPEFEAECRLGSASANDLLQGAARHKFGLLLVPMDWVSSQIEMAKAVFAEVRPSLRQQVCRIGRLPEGLIGYQGASEYDFWNSKFRRVHRERQVLGEDQIPYTVTVPMDTVASTAQHSTNCVA